MGVKGLWRILEEAQESVALEELRGSVLALDASGWVVHMGLRSFFYRVRNLIGAGIVPLVVLDGRVPEGKEYTVAERRRLASQYQSRRMSSAMRKKKYGDSCTVRPTTDLYQVLHGLGVPVVRSEGEAEKLCAWLDRKGVGMAKTNLLLHSLNEVVDGVITDDSDVFLYGAKTVYRQMSTCKHGLCKRIIARDVLTWCGLTRWTLLGVAALHGCDFIPSGVRGIGMKKALNLALQADLRHKRGLRKFLELFFKGVNRKVLNVFLREFLTAPALWDFVHTEMREPDIYTLVAMANREWGWPSKQSLKSVAPVLVRWHLGGDETTGVEIHPVSATGTLGSGVLFQQKVQFRVKQGNIVPNGKDVVAEVQCDRPLDLRQNIKNNEQGDVKVNEIGRDKERNGENEKERKEMPTHLKVCWILQSHGIEVRFTSLEDLETLALVYDIKEIASC